MLPLLTLLSLLAVLLTQISSFQHSPECRRWYGRRLRTRIDRSTTESIQPAIWCTDCPLAAAYQAGVPPGLHSVSLVQVPRVFKQLHDRMAGQA